MLVYPRYTEINNKQLRKSQVMKTKLLNEQQSAVNFTPRKELLTIMFNRTPSPI